MKCIYIFSIFRGVAEFGLVLRLGRRDKGSNPFIPTNLGIIMKNGDIVLIKEYEKDNINRHARVMRVYPDNKAWVSNLNMPYLGTVSKIYKISDLMVIKPSKIIEKSGTFFME